MNPTQQKLRACGVRVPEILLPAAHVSPERFAVIACDQFSADVSYWRKAEELVGDAPSALRLMLPEAYLKEGRDGGDIPATMNRYLEDGSLVSVGETMVFVRRETTSGTRRGLVLAIDLEQYDYRVGSDALVRATEQTVVERLPARVAIRREASIELPHILVLVDDPDDTLLTAASACAVPDNRLYDFSLMLDGGRIEGYALRDESVLTAVAGALDGLRAQGDGFLFAMGDGNHSFAAAKDYWDEIKGDIPEAQREDHLARYALCEVVNVYDDALGMCPIHRLLLGVDPDAVQREVGFDAADPPSLQDLQPMLDRWFQNHPEAEQEYIHGDDECRALAAAAPDRLAILFPAFDKSSVFRVVRENGCFQRKSFSIGEARDKRYYLEARAIR